MNRINQLFSTKQKDILSIYFCAGFPTLEGIFIFVQAFLP